MKLAVFLSLLLSLYAISDEIDHAIVSVYAVDMKTGEVVLDRNSELSMIPASCLKIITTATALHILGEDFCYKTALECDGDRKGKALKGNLYIKGGGDPCLGSGRVKGSLGWKEQIQEWVDVIQKEGITKIEGQIIGDDSLWESPRGIPSWTLEDVGNYYGAPPSALSFHENSYSLILQPGFSVGDRVAILATEPPQQTIFYNELKTAETGSGDQACIYGSEFSVGQGIRGSVPIAKEFSIKGAILHPATYTAGLLKKRLEELGVAVLGKKVLLSEERRGLCISTSPKVSEIIYHTNQKSINLYAEHLLKKMGEVVKGEGSTTAGIQVVRDFWKQQGMDLEGFQMMDGSGLSRKNLIQTKQLVHVLIAMKGNLSFFYSLPEKEPGIRGKTGGMSFVRGYAGYVEDIAFAIVINHCVSPEQMHQKIDEIISNLKGSILAKNRQSTPLL